MEFLTTGIIATFLLLYGLISNRIMTTLLTGPILFVLFGYVLSGDVFSLVTGRDHFLVSAIANITLILILFSDASRINLSFFRKKHDLPRRLLAIGLPLTICFGTLCAALLFPQVPFWQAAVLATALAPTDAALAQVVINSKLVPERISEALNVESGLNDGICFPILLMFLSLADDLEANSTIIYWVQFIGLQLLLGPIIGGVIGLVGGKLTLWGVESKWMSKHFQRLSMIALSFMAFCFSDLAGGNGFIAAFFAGLFFGYAAHKVSDPIYEFGESIGELFILLTFMLFGAILVPFAIHELNWVVMSYAILSLTIVRIIPVAISLMGRGLSTASIVYIGWFGPRGAASILYLLLIVSKYNLTEENLIFDVATTTILLSVILHGMTAAWGSNKYVTEIHANGNHGKISI